MDPVRNKPPRAPLETSVDTRSNLNFMTVKKPEKSLTGRAAAAVPRKAGERISNGVEVLGLKPRYRSLEKELALFLKKAAILLKRAENPFDVYLVPLPVIRFLNRKYRKIDKITDVLAFPLGSFPYPGSGKKPLGEIYLAPDYIRERGGDIKRLALHGFLHLLGYTHNKKDDRIRMEKMENKLYSLIARQRLRRLAR